MSTINTAVFVCMNILGLYPNSNFDHGLGGWANDEKRLQWLATNSTSDISMRNVTGQQGIVLLSDPQDIEII